MIPGNSTSTSESEVEPQILARSGRLKLLVFGLVAIIAVCVFWQLRSVLTFEYLAQRESDLRSYQATHLWLVSVIAVVAYIIVAGLSLPGATVLTLLCGWFFEFWLGLLLVSVGSTAGATLALLLSRYLLRDWVERRFERQLQPVMAAFEREGAYYLFTLRLIPAVPFFVINLVMGLTKVRWTTFWWVSQLGMLPATAAYVYAGSTVPSLKKLAEDGPGRIFSWQLIFALTILGALPLALKKILQVRQPRP